MKTNDVSFFFWGNLGYEIPFLQTTRLFYGLIWAGRRAVGLNVITNDVSQINTIWAGSTYFENINWAEL